MQNLKTLLFKTKYPSWMLFVVAGILTAGIGILVLGDGSLVTQVKKLQKQLYETVSLVSCDESYPDNYFRVCYYEGISPGTGQFLGSVEEPSVPAPVPETYIALEHLWGDGIIFSDVSDNISAVWRGRFNFPQGRYQFTVHTDDGIRLYVNEQLVIEEWRDQEQSFAAGVDLDGSTTIRIEWYDNTGSAQLKLYWYKTSKPPSTVISPVRVDFYVLSQIDTCFAGNPCTSEECFNIHNADHSVYKSFAKDASLKSLEPSDLIVSDGTYPQVECLSLAVPPEEQARVIDNVQRVLRNVETRHTMGAFDITLHTYILDPVEVELSPTYGLFWLSPYLASPIFARQRAILGEPFTSETDFVIVTHGLNEYIDGEYGKYIGPPICGGTVGVGDGIGGAGYSWVPQTRPGIGFECSTYSVYINEWLHQVPSAVRGLMGLDDIYVDPNTGHRTYPPCGTYDPDTYKWFPSHYDIDFDENGVSDPDSPWCETSGPGPDAGGAHLFLNHFDFSMQHYSSPVFNGNHCNNGIKDFNETGVDTGGHCQYLGLAWEINPPEVTITSPLDGAALEQGATITVSADATDDSAVERVEFFKDGERFATDGSPPYSASLMVTSPIGSSVVLTATAYDIWLNSATSSPVIVTVAPLEPPEVTITSPQNGAIIENCGRVKISADASDLSGIRGVSFYANNNKLVTAVSAPYETMWNIPAGVTSATLKAIAHDNAMLLSVAQVTVSFIDPLPLSVYFTNPQENDVLSGTVPVTVKATDCPSGYQIDLFDSSETHLGVIGAGFRNENTFSVDWNTTAESDGLYYLEATVWNTDFVDEAHSPRLSVTINKPPPCDSYGDVDSDGYVTNEDAEMVMKHAVEEIVLSSEEQERADVDVNQKVEGVDALLISQYVQGLRDTFLACETTPPTTPGTPYLSSGTNPNNTGTYTITWTVSIDTESGLKGYDVLRNGATVNSSLIRENTYSEINLLEGSHTYVIYAVDNGGNVSSPSGVSVPIIVDKTPPTGTIRINNDAIYTKSTSVTLNLSASDTGGSGLDKMQFSNDNVNWSTPEAYATTYAWTLTPGEGEKTVYARFKDKAGNWSDVVSDTIILEKDSDNDGFSDRVELFMGTDPFRACGENAWPPDFNDDGIVQIDDVTFVVGKFGLSSGDPGYTPRAELVSQDGIIQIDDVARISGFFGQSCTP